MIYSKTDVAGTVEILASDKFTAIPFKLAAASGVTVVKAGTPITSAGVADTDGEAAVGVLLYDTDVTRNPNCALLVQGVLDLTKAKAHSGVSGMTAAKLQGAVPGIVCRENIGVNP